MNSEKEGTFLEELRVALSYCVEKGIEFPVEKVFTRLAKCIASPQLRVKNGCY